MRAFVVAGLLAAAGTSPEFQKFPSEAKLIGRAAAVRMENPEARRFRTVLRRAAAEGPNFNGHYRIVYWGGGTGVVSWAVIDLSTGVVWFAPQPAGICQSDEAKEDDLGYFQHRLDSALFYLNDCDWDRPRTRLHNIRYVYVWQKGAPVLLRDEALK
jgi:hypothetical protein